MSKIMLLIFIFVGLAFILVGCSKDREYSPVFPDGLQLYSDDGGEHWQYVANDSLKKIAGCSCNCTFNSAGVYPGGCVYMGVEYSCNDWCGKR